MRTPATNGARRLREKLTELAARPGTLEEGKAARAKLTRLENRYDFGQVNVSKEGIFAGTFTRSPYAVSVGTLAPAVAWWVKWAIEEATKVPCAFRGPDLVAEVAPSSAPKLAGIAQTISAGFAELWGRFRTFPTITPDAQDIFFRGLYDGMMSQEKQPGQALPTFNRAPVKSRAKRGAVSRPAGLEVHPYSIALDLGRGLRFNSSLSDLTAKLEEARQKVVGALPA